MGEIQYWFNGLPYGYIFAAGPVNLKTFNGLLKGSIKTIDGLAMTNIKTVDGLT